MFQPLYINHDQSLPMKSNEWKHVWFALLFRVLNRLWGTDPVSIVIFIPFSHSMDWFKGKSSPDANPISDFPMKYMGLYQSNFPSLVQIFDQWWWDISLVDPSIGSHWIPLKIVCPWTQWFCWSLSLWKMAISLGILTQHFQVQTHWAPFLHGSRQVIPVICGTSRVVTLLGETGSGKSTQVPQMILAQARQGGWIIEGEYIYIYIYI